MARYYYTDALKAAWMNQAFGFDFHYDLTDLNVNILGAYYVKTKNYIHPDCHEMLKPQDGDIGSDGTYPARFEQGAWRSDEYIDLGEDSYTIIKRNGKLFFMPEEEGD